MASANGLGSRQQRLERVGQGVHAGRRGRRRRYADGQRGVQDGPAWQHRRMADVVLATGRLIGDDAVGVGLGTRAGGRRDAMTGTPGEVLAVVAQGQDLAAIRGVEALTLAESIDEPPPTGTTTVPSSPNADSAPMPRGDRQGTGVRLDRVEQRVLTPAASSTPTTARRPGADDPWVGDDERALTTDSRTSSGRWRRPRRRSGLGREAAVPAFDRPGSSPPHRTSSTRSPLVSRRTVSQRRQPSAWNQRSVVAPSGLSKIQTSSKSRASGSVDRRGAVRRSPPNTNSSSGRRPQRGQSSVASARPRRAVVGQDVVAGETIEREGRDERRRRPVAISSAMPSPPAGIALKPHVPQPVVT